MSERNFVITVLETAVKRICTDAIGREFSDKELKRLQEIHEVLDYVYKKEAEKSP